jgi:hypothetical protein
MPIKIAKVNQYPHAYHPFSYLQSRKRKEKKKLLSIFWASYLKPCIEIQKKI